ncbi:PHP domain-containing protein [Acidobacteria bacterium AB60]|nr:PHP domain-containing protein [Acidobacteria bacterium AB60]
MKKLLVPLLLFVFLLCGHPALTQTQNPDLVLRGKVTGAQNKTYLDVPFEVPAGVHRISVDFSYTGKERKTAIDLGIEDPQRFRGYSGGNKAHFTIGESDATPSYLPGPIPAGKWKLLLSVPNIRPSEESEYRAEIRFNSEVEDHGFAQAPLETGTRWYRGDLHMHTAHSDGSCVSQSGNRVPCPVFLTAQAAVAQGLDFIAITDHNAVTHYDDMRELQPYFDRLLLIPGREMTTFWGHFNIFGVTRYLDYRVVERGGRSVNDVLREVRDMGGIASINHAESPSGEICMGCKWEPSNTVDMSLFTGVEVINGGRHPLISANFWDKQLAQGEQLTAIGGSDSHNGPALPGESGAIGWPTTVVQASELSVPAILEGIRKGRVFIDLTASRDKVIDLEARDSADAGEWTRMGGTLAVSSGHSVAFRILLDGCAGSMAHVLVDGLETPSLAPLPASKGTEALSFSWMSDGNAHWMRVEVRDSKGVLQLLSNPIYLNHLNR